MGWDVEAGDEFEADFKELPDGVQTEILAHARLLQQFGPKAAQPLFFKAKPFRNFPAEAGVCEPG